LHFILRVRLAHRGGSIITRQATAVERESGVDQRQMDRAADQIVDQDSLAADAQTFVDEAYQFFRAEMVREQCAADQVETVLTEGKSQSISNHRAPAIANMSGSTVEECQLKLNALMRQALLGDALNVS